MACIKASSHQHVQTLKRLEVENGTLCEHWALEQQRLAEFCVEEDQLDWEVHGEFISGLQRVAGVDVSFFPDGCHAVAAIVVISFSTFEVIYERCVTYKLAVPYIPHFLAFREVPALEKLLREVPCAFTPQVVIVDGNGVYHPRRCGLATHLGVVTGLPTVGVAKKILKVDDVTAAKCRKLAASLDEASDWVSLGKRKQEEEGKCIDANTHDSALAVLLRSSYGKQTLVVSPGHLVSLRTARIVTAALCRKSIPEPVRLADVRSRAAVSAWLEGKELEEIKVGLYEGTIVWTPEFHALSRKRKNTPASEAAAQAEAAKQTLCGVVSQKKALNATKMWQCVSPPKLVWRVKPRKDANEITHEALEAPTLDKPACRVKPCNNADAERLWEMNTFLGDDASSTSFWAYCVNWLGGLCCSRANKL